MNIQKEYQDICNYLKNEYGIDTWIDKYLHSDYIFFKQGNNIYNIGINEPYEKTFAPKEYLIDFGYESKDRKEGGGYMLIYKSNEIKDIDEFLKQKGFEKAKFQQQSLF